MEETPKNDHFSFQHRPDFWPSTQFFDVTGFLHFWAISEGYGPRDRHGWIRLEISCRTVWSRNWGLSRRPVSCHFLLSTSTAHFLANNFSSPPPSLEAYPPLCPPNIQSNTKIDTICIPKKRRNGCRHPSFFRIHVDNINFLTPQHQFSSSKPEGGLAFKLGGVLGNWTNEKPPSNLLTRISELWSTWVNFQWTFSQL